MTCLEEDRKPQQDLFVCPPCHVIILLYFHPTVQVCQSCSKNVMLLLSMFLFSLLLRSQVLRRSISSKSSWTSFSLTSVTESRNG
jgi:hypothetical protein